MDAQTKAADDIAALLVSTPTKRSHAFSFRSGTDGNLLNDSSFVLAIICGIMTNL